MICSNNSLNVIKWNKPSNLKKSVVSFVVRNAYYKVKVKVARSCLALCYPMEVSLSGSSVHGIPQARILERAAISSSRGSYRPRDRTQVSRIAGGFVTSWAIREALNRRRSTIWPSNPTPGHINPEKTIIHKDTPTPMFKAEQFMTVKTRKTLSVHRQRNRWKRCGTFIQWSVTQPRKGMQLSNL